MGFEGNEDIFGGADEQAGMDDLVLDLSGDDLAVRDWKPIPDNTWVKAVIYDAELGTVKNPNSPNVGKPQAIFTFKLVEESAKEFGPKTFRVWAQLYSGAFFTMFNIMRAVKEQLGELGYEVPSAPPAAGQPMKLRLPPPAKLKGLTREARVKNRPGNKPGAGGKPVMFESLVGFRAPKDEESMDGLEEFTSGGGNKLFQ